MSNIVEGGCFCGSVRYSFKFDKYPSANCYCSICRRISGAPFVSWLAIPVNLFKYLKNKPKKTAKKETKKETKEGEPAKSKLAE